MLPRRLLPLLACAAAVLASCAATASAASWPVTPVVVGGKVTYSGGISGTLKSNNPETSEYYNETAGLDFAMTSYAGDLYGGLSVVDDGGASTEVKDYTAIPGSGTVSANFRHWDSTKGYYWESLSCKNGGKSITPPAPARGLSGQLHPGGGVGFVDFATGSTCSNARNDDKTGNAIGSTLVGVVGGATIPVSGNPPAGASKSFNVPLNSDEAACPPNGLPNCKYGYSGEGHVKVECAVCLTKVELEQVHVRTGEPVDVPSTGTIDGNRVFVTATFTNTSPYTIKSIVKWRERVGKRDLIDAGFSNEDPWVTFPAGQAKTVTFEWDTSGFAWEKGKPTIDRELEIRNGWGGGFVKVKVRPKPIIAVHGWNADQAGWDVAKQVIPSAIAPDFADRVYAVGDSKGRGSMDTHPAVGKPISYNAGQEAEYIQSVREAENAQHVDVVAHSMGGLISRYYIQKLMPEPFSDYRPMVSHLVMLGTPNMGSPCADVIGVAARGIPTDQLKPDFVEGVFNKEITDRRMVPFSIMAGDWNERTCTSPEHGDLVVALSSAWWTIDDVAKTYAQHLELTDLASIFSSFVKPRIGLDPDQAENLYQQVPGATGAALKTTTKASMAGREAAAAPATPDFQAGVAKTVTIPAGGSVDVAIPVGTASALSAGTTAGPDVTSSLIAPGGAVADTVAAGSDAAQTPMRFHRVASPATGTWTLRLAQKGAVAKSVAVVGAFEGSPLVLKAAHDGGRVTATLRNGDAGVPGATVEAELRADGQATRTLTLKDDGNGSYSAAANLPAGEWFGTVHSASGAGERFANLAASGAPAGGDGGGGGGPAGGGDPAPGGGATGGGATTGGGPTTGGGSSTKGGGTAGGASSPAARPAVVAVSLKAKRARVRRAPYRFTLSGKLSPKCPAQTKVLVALTAGGKTVAKATVAVNAKCAFSAKVKVAKRAKLRATAAVVPSSQVAAAVSRPLSLRAG